MQFVFGYASLVALAHAPTRAQDLLGFVATLRGHRRTWGVAMDNRVDIPGYKYYREPAGGGRPEVHVAFIDLLEDSDGEINGVLLPTTTERLRELDARELNYERVEVTERFASLGARVWVYRGRADSRERMRAALAAGTAVVQHEYLELVQAGFRDLGPREHEEFLASTDPPPCPVRTLERVDIGPSG